MGSELDRPQALTPQVQQQIVTYLAEGNYLNTACEAAGISVDCFYYWKKLLEAGADHAQVYADFFGAVKRASATSELAALREVKGGAPGWQGNAWFLERRFPRRWAKKDQVTVTATTVDMSTLSKEELEAIARGKGKGRA